jgi:hypothetical protein
VEVAALGVSFIAVAVAIWGGYRSQRLARHGNTLPILTELFREHRSRHLADARAYVHHRLPADLSGGLDALPEAERRLVRDLAWFYDNLGALVAHDVVEAGPVAGYLGGSVISTWDRLEPLVAVERERRAGGPDGGRWQEYFENMAHLFRHRFPPER